MILVEVKVKFHLSILDICKTQESKNKADHKIFKKGARVLSWSTCFSSYTAQETHGLRTILRNLAKEKLRPAYYKDQLVWYTEIRTRLKDTWHVHFHVHVILSKLVVFSVLDFPTLKWANGLRYSKTAKLTKTPWRSNEIKDVKISSKIIWFICKMLLISPLRLNPLPIFWLNFNVF